MRDINVLPTASLVENQTEKLLAVNSIITSPHVENILEREDDGQWNEVRRQKSNKPNKDGVHAACPKPLRGENENSPPLNQLKNCHDVIEYLKTENLDMNRV